MAVSMIPDTISPVYDLFCDHGKLGEYFLPEREVYFNDQKDFLLNSVQKRIGCSDDYLLYGPAQDLVFKPNATVFMLGVGGLLMVDCFQRWKENQPQELLEDLTFILSPHYYLLELAQSLNQFGAYCLERNFVWESGRGYEFFKIKIGEKSKLRPFEIFDREFWTNQMIRNNHARTYLEERLQFTDSYHDPEDQVLTYQSDLKKFLENK